MADDASTDGTAEWLARVHPEVRVVRLERNGGFCAAANAGIAAARGRFIQLLNNDTEVAAGWIEAGLAPFADPTVGVGRTAGLGAVRPRLAWIRPATRIHWPAGRPSGATASPAHSLPTAPVEEVFGASGSSAFYRSAALRRAGGFDPLLGSYYEDIDLAFRLRWAGYRCLFAPRCGDLSRRLGDLRPRQPRRSSAAWPGTPRSSSGPTCPPAVLPLAIVPHLVFWFCKESGGWRAAGWGRFCWASAMRSHLAGDQGPPPVPCPAGQASRGSAPLRAGGWFTA